MNNQRIIKPVTSLTPASQGVSTSLSEAEKHKLLVEWNSTAVEYPQDKCIHELFEAQVKKTPEAVAVIFENQQLSYFELDKQANQLANNLQNLGVKSEMLVGLFLERSLEMVVGLLGILKAGGAYVPMDPQYPKERLAFMLQDSQISLLITQSSLLDSCKNLNPMPLLNPCKILNLDVAAINLTSIAEKEPSNTIKPQKLAYVMFTSGSTGKPKGVMIEHRSVVNHLHWRQKTFPVKNEDCFLQKASFSFDISIWEIFTPLISGARLILAKPDGQKDPTYLVRLMAKHKVTMAHFGPALLQALVDEPEFSRCNDLRQVFCGGEPLPGELQKRFFSRSNAELISQYGPTEATVDATWCRCERVNATITAPIGRPIANTQIYILNEQLQPVPVGEGGELHIGGEGLARGYLNRPELTAEKFIVNPFNDEPGARIYKTGDLARYLPNGNIEFLGRLDQQVKIRGFRIELGEIEAVLAAHPNVLHSVVVAREEIPGNKILAAYLVVRQEPPPTATELRTFLSDKLPDYMIPTTFVRLAKLPLNPNGKIDRKSLPAPDTGDLGSGIDFVTPRTETEKRLAEIWSEVLGLKQIGIHANFFELGGHSLLAVRLVFQIRNLFSVEIPIKSIAEFPTLAGLAAKLDEFNPKSQTNLASELLAAGSTNLPIKSHAESVDISNKRHLKPTSFNQAQLWFIHLLDPKSVVYNVVKVIRLNGQLNLPALTASLNELFRRHEILRTTFEALDGEPMQAVAAPSPINCPTLNLNHLLELEQESEVIRLAELESSLPFDLKLGSLVRLRLLSLGEQNHVLLLSLHHIVWDGLSMAVLLRDVTTSYESFCRIGDARLPDLAIQYADFAIWQKQQLQPQLIERHLNYWRLELADVPQVLEMPTNHPREGIRNRRCSEQHFNLSPTTTSALRKLGQKYETTAFVTLLAAFHALLYRYTRQEKILIGVPFAGRNISELDKLIGFFVNSLPVKADFSQHPSFVELLRQVHEALWTVQSHQDLPFDQLVRELQPIRESNRNPLFQVCVVLEVMPVEQCRMADLQVNLKAIEPPEAMFELTLSLTDKGGEFDCALRYDADLFDDSTITRLVHNYQTVLESVTANPKQRVSEMRLLSESEQHLVLKEWNQTGQNYPHDKSVHELFEAQVESTPKAVALVFENQELTYHQLNERADRLAQHLKSLGVGSDTLVGLFVERSLEMVVGLLGILKAGGAYVPMDPQYPLERLAYMLEDARPLAIVTQQKLRDQLPPHQAQVIFVDASDGMVASKSDSRSAQYLCPQADRLAYVIYTSGSTGKPKGVQITHRALTNFLISMQVKPGFQSHDVLLAVTTLSFDIAGLEIFLPLISGARLIIAGAETMTDGAALTVLMQHCEVTFMQATPVTWRLLLEAGWAGNSKLKILCGGEAWSTSLADQLLPRCQSLWNMYGPTETTIWSAATQIESGRPVSIGQPIANTSFYILDEALQPVPIGVAGELHIGGDGLARGYHNHPELTAEKFITDPFSPNLASRLYKTGDSVRHLLNGDIEFLGRIDHQVKIRGFRIELGEIEAVLATHPNVLNSVVVTREDVTGSKHLVAYLIVRQQPPPAVAELRAFIGQKLPEYMVPAAFVTLTSLPLTPNGKIDRKALPAPDEKHLGASAESTPPRNPIEAELAKIWCEILGISSIGIRDNFFTIGGHSLLAVRLVNQIGKLLNHNVPIPTFFRNPTIEKVAQIIQLETRTNREPKLTTLISGDTNRNIFFLDAGVGLCRLAQLVAVGSSAFATTVPLSAKVFQAAKLNKTADLPSLEELAAPHTMLIQSHQPTGSCLLVGHSFGGLLAFEVAHQLQQVGRHVEMILLLDSWAKTPPWWRKLSILTLARARQSLQFRAKYWWSKIMTNIAGWLLSTSNSSKAADFPTLPLDYANQPFGDVPWEIMQRVHRHARKNYQFIPLKTRAILFRAQNSESAHLHDMDANFGWNGILTGGLETVDTPGDHFTLLKNPNLQILATHFNECLKKSR